MLKNNSLRSGLGRSYFRHFILKQNPFTTERLPWYIFAQFCLWFQKFFSLLIGIIFFLNSTTKLPHSKLLLYCIFNKYIRKNWQRLKIFSYFTKFCYLHKNLLQTLTEINKYGRGNIWHITLQNAPSSLIYNRLWYENHSQP